MPPACLFSWREATPGGRLPDRALSTSLQTDISTSAHRSGRQRPFRQPSQGGESQPPARCSVRERAPSAASEGAQPTPPPGAAARARGAGPLRAGKEASTPYRASTATLAIKATEARALGAFARATTLPCRNALSACSSRVDIVTLSCSQSTVRL